MCDVECDVGYDQPTETNEYEECGPQSNWMWTFQERKEHVMPCMGMLGPYFWTVSIQYINSFGHLHIYSMSLIFKVNHAVKLL